MPQKVVFAIIVLLCSCSGKKEEWKVNIREGGLLYKNTCQSCHGPRGEGNPQLKSPSLTSLDQWYLFRQAVNFRKDIRGYDAHDTVGHQMAAMVKTLADTSAVRNVVAFIDSLPDVNLEETLTGNWKNGENIYQSVCGSCHGPEGKGNPRLDAPRLNGLPSWYLKSQLEKFKNGTRGTHPEDKFGAQMTSMVALVRGETAVTDVITYLRSKPAEAK